MDMSEGEYERNDTFDFTSNIRDWLCCFNNKKQYGFTSWNNTIDISESDFYDAEKDTSKEKNTTLFIFVIKILIIVH